eukprot:m.143282 g.143282  ORF g.143282 m.143282 type:complete len:137 (+) comp14984_c0_seq2:825-1235(+)
MISASQLSDLQAFEERMRQYVEHWDAANRAWDRHHILLFGIFSSIVFFLLSGFLFWLDPFKDIQCSYFSWIISHLLLSCVLTLLSLHCGYLAATIHHFRPPIDVRLFQSVLATFNLRCDRKGRLVLPAQYRRPNVR